MLTFENTVAQMLVLTIAGSVLAGSIVLWTAFSGIRKEASVGTLSAWSDQWLDLLIAIWATVFAIVMFNWFAHAWLVSGADEPEVASSAGMTWGHIAYSATIQVAFLMVVLGAKQAYALRYLPDTIGWRKGNRKAMIRGLDTMVRYFPLIWLSSALWIWVVQMMELSSGVQEAVQILLGIEDSVKFVALVLLSVGVAPVLEELFFRGLVLRFLVNKLPFWVANTVTSVFFAALHFSVDALLPIFILSLLLGHSYRQSGDIRSAIWMHVAFNSYTVLLIMVERFTVS